MIFIALRHQDLLLELRQRYSSVNLRMVLCKTAIAENGEL